MKKQRKYRLNAVFCPFLCWANYQKHWIVPPVRYCESVSRPILIFFENLKHKLVTKRYQTGALKNEFNIVLLPFLWVQVSFLNFI